MKYRKLLSLELMITETTSPTTTSQNSLSVLMNTISIHNKQWEQETDMLMLILR